jgi:hypothetical protein
MARIGVSKSRNRPIFGEWDLRLGVKRSDFRTHKTTSTREKTPIRVLGIKRFRCSM